MKKHPLILCAGITSLLLSACNPVKAPEAILPVPEAKQVAENGNLRFCTFRT